MRNGYLLLCISSIFLMASGGLNVGLSWSHQSMKAIALSFGTIFIVLGFAGIILSFYFSLKKELSDVENERIAAVS